MDPPPEPTAQGGGIDDPILFQAIRRGLFDRRAIGDLLHRFIPGGQAIGRPVDTLRRQHGQRTAAQVTPSAPHTNPVMGTIVRGPQSPSVTDNSLLVTRGTLARQPFALISGVAFVAGTWDNNDHSRREGASRSVPRQGTLLQAVAFAPMY